MNTRRNRLVLVVLALAFTLASCGGGGDSNAEGATRTVLVDYNHDEFATSYFGYFPRYAGAPGRHDRVQAGVDRRAHTVTLGTLRQPVGNLVEAVLRRDEGGTPGDEGPPGMNEALEGLPEFFGKEDAQPDGRPSRATSTRAPSRPTRSRARRPISGRPTSTASQTFYNSGFIPYEGNNGNQFKMQLVDDIAPGDYFYYCLLHGAGMGGYLQVKPATESMPPGRNTTARRARNSTRRRSRLTKAHSQRLAGKRHARREPTSWPAARHRE